jgi:serine/threonine protein kinase
MIGQLLAGHYRILEVLGAGGFGQTYITEDLHLPGNPKCVLKHLKPASADGSFLTIARKLFEKEAIVLQQLGNHDRIPRLLAYFEENREFYLVQEYIQGHTLSKELTNGSKWIDRQVIELLDEVLDILVFIHGQGVIHRDIKPDNIMRRDRDRRLVLIDFGAIKQVRNQQATQGQHTMTVAIGTPGYMPIEQSSGNPRASSDLYSLGVLGIQALTGVNPYDLAEDDRTGELKWEHFTIASPQLIAILQRMTRYHFKDRYLTAAEALQAVKGLISGNATPDPTYVRASQKHSIESQATLVVPRSVTAAPINTPQPNPKSSRGKFLLIGGLATILTTVAGFAWISSKLFEFSSNLLARRNFEADLQSNLCRIATPSDLPATKVRVKPQRDAKIQTKLPRGTKVVFLSEQDTFVQIQMADNSTGWVYNNQIASCKVPIATPKPKPSPANRLPSAPAVPSPQSIPVPPPKQTEWKPIDPPTISPNPTPSVIPTLSPSSIPTLTPTPTPTSTPFSAPRGGIQPSPPTLTPTPIPTPIPTPSPLGKESISAPTPPDLETTLPSDKSTVGEESPLW